jgi:SAM-dependent methyltransferase
MIALGVHPAFVTSISVQEEQMKVRSRELIKQVANRLPAVIYVSLSKLDDRIESLRNAHKTSEEVFNRIYGNNVWGGAKGEFYSGPGSHIPEASLAYVRTIRELALKEGFDNRKFVDLGCGDFSIGRQIAKFSSHYIGVDIVQGLVSHNQELFGNNMIAFTHRDIVTDPIPEGDVCLIRQVLQHLSNEQISSILVKLHRFKWVIITEHHPRKSDFVPNRNKIQGGSIRLIHGSGVVLTAPPFSLDPFSVRLVSEWLCSGGNRDMGVIRTYLWKPDSTENPGGGI